MKITLNKNIVEQLEAEKQNMLSEALEIFTTRKVKQNGDTTNKRIKASNKQIETVKAFIFKK
ncbi:TPA: hypothetical protein KNH38_003614 [Clostridioides difficile]|uniref:hypothetical protein n=1 Tax=Clostridioides difficile TaxID=1496 RepID=UPI0021C812EF|nr:hypothetical protein [Clostridioides difficile]UUV16806.1 hypothetical protein NQ183_20585 [Clostridioides difficile]HBE9272018.1 hypothetical protein [Clostridioides difficile]